MNGFSILAILVGLILLLVLIVSLLSLVDRRRIVKVSIPASLDQIRRLAGMVETLASDANLSEEAVHQCRLAVDEACANIITHSYAGNPSGVIEVKMIARRGHFEISLTDFGEPYDPALVTPPNIDCQSLDEASPGGLGLYLMHRVMDRVNYTVRAEGNSLVMTKLSNSFRSAAAPLSR
ncbi:MAG: ATP-binding protein [Anaerolineae bacterium]|nr:ATP-binding protein [Anaerolineae bacterium]